MSLKYRMIREAGPYKVTNRADGTMHVEPEWPKFPKWNPEDGGGPGIGSRFALAYVLEAMLNAYVHGRKQKEFPG